jgi:invasion protein IalB
MKLFRVIATLAALTAGTALAQDQSGGLAMGESADGPEVGQVFVKEEFGSWQQRCVKTEDGERGCQLYQLLLDGNGNSVAEVSMFAVAGDARAEGGATIMTPLETLLTRQLTISVDGAPGKRYPFTFCNRSGCVARVGFTGDDLAAFRRGNLARITLFSITAPESPVTLEISLEGFTAGFAALEPRGAN